MKKILIIEDDEFLIDTYSVRLKQENFDVASVRDGEAAFEKAKKFMPNLIILDLILPKKDGFKVLEELKGNAKTREIPILIASNLDQEESIQRGLRMGAANYFVKSNISINELTDKCNKYVA